MMYGKYVLSPWMLMLAIVVLYFLPWAVSCSVCLSLDARLYTLACIRVCRGVVHVAVIAV